MTDTSEVVNELAANIRSKLDEAITLHNQLGPLLAELCAENNLTLNEAQTVVHMYSLEKLLEARTVMRRVIVDVPSVEKVN